MDSLSKSFVQEKYIYELAQRLEKFFGHKGCFNFRCPICGDSKSNTNKKRGYLYQTKSSLWVFKCFNCGSAMSFENFLKTVDESLFSMYKRETSLGAMKLEKDETPTANDFHVSSRQKEILNHVGKSLSLPHECDGLVERLDTLAKSHKAVEYLDSRFVPHENRRKVYWTGNFKKLVDNLMPNKYDVSTLPNEGILFPIFGMSDGSFHGFQIRVVDADVPKERRFKTCVKDSAEYGCFGYEGKEPEYVVEGPVDSLFLPNCVAVLSSSLYRVGEFFPKAKYVNDNEPQNEQIVSVVKKCVERGLTTVMLPDIVDSTSILGYDLNDLCKEFKWDMMTLKEFIDEHAYKGLKARVMVANWSTQSC